MEENKEMKYVCKFCNKKFSSGKSFGGHIRIHMNESLVDSNSYNSNNTKKKRKKLVEQREIVALKQQQQQLCCRECGKGFVSLKDLCAHTCQHEGEKMMMNSESDTETSLEHTKRVVKQSNSESVSNESSSYASEIDQEHKDGAFSLMMMSKASGEQLKILNVKNQDKLRSGDDNGVSLCDSDSSDYYMNGPKNSESDFCADINSKILHRFSDNKSRMVVKASSAKKKSKDNKCPFCFKVFKSGQALGGHKRSHSIRIKYEHKIKHQTYEMCNQIDLNLPASDIDE